MLSHLKLSNFRHFDDEVCVRFRPITVLIGRNSSGKSTIIKSLLMLKQSVMSSSENFPVVNGDLVRLGGFSGLKNTRSEKQNLGFNLFFHSPPLEFIDLAPRIQEGDIDVDRENTFVSVRGEIPYSDSPQNSKIFYMAGEREDPGRYFDFVTNVRDDEIFYLDTLKTRDSKTWRSFREFSSRISSGEGPVPDKWLAKLTEEIIENEIGSVFQKELNSIIHLPPIRGELSRLVDFSATTKDSTERRRVDTLVQLLEIEQANAESFKFLSKHLLDVIAIESIKFRADPLEEGQVIAKNNDTGAEVPIVDFGFGVSQFLPVLVEGTTMPSGSCLMVEQPEAQLHPTAQLHLGSFFAELWTERGVNSIIETHSQNILLRLRRLIARGDLSHDDVSVAYFTFDKDRGNTPIVRNLDVYENGSMEPGLPMEFFAEDIREGLKLGARE